MGTPETPNSDPIPHVDASRPFRSVKEAVAIFGDRIFFGEIRSSPKLPSVLATDELSYAPDLAQSPGKPASTLMEQDVASSLEGQPYSSEITMGQTESPMYGPTPSAGKLEKENPSEDKGVGLLLDGPSYSSEIPLGPTEAESELDPLSIDSKQVAETPMYGPTPCSSNPKKQSHGNIVHGNDLVMMLMVLKKLEAELQETKTELKLLKERGSETEVALACLNAELHKNMSKIAQAEANEAAKATTKLITPSVNEGQTREMETSRDEERTRRDLMAKTIDSPTLAQILSISDYEGYFKESKLKTRKLMKKKPIIPLVTDLIPWKKKATPTHAISEPILSKMYFT